MNIDSDELPSFEKLESLGADAGAYLDATEAELERAIPMAAHKSDRTHLADKLKQLARLRDRWFS